MTRRDHPFGGRTGRIAAGALVFVLWTLPARANTYLFSFTASQVLAALRTSQGYVTEQSSGYYGIWMTPSLANFSFATETAPNGGYSNTWRADTIYDPADLGGSTATWAGFHKLTNTLNVALLSDANNGGTSADNIFLYNSYTGSTAPPVPFGWGPQTQSIAELIPSTAKFQFSIVTSATLSGSYTVSGKASGLISGATDAMTGGTKDFSNLNFSLTGTPTEIPEPAEWSLLGAGVFGLVLLRRFRPGRR